MKKIFLICLLLLLYLANRAQNTITGTISDQNNRPLSGASVFLPEINKGTVSDDNGKYKLSNLPNGKFKVQFSFIGYSNKIESIGLNNSNITLNTTLVFSIIGTEEIVITGGYNSTQHENAVKIETLKLRFRDIKSSPNFMEVLTKIPG
ncbi:MAG: carboxypeptidase-like regulatory domain-containing protein, partial [Bacteroidales bacterium]